MALLQSRPRANVPVLTHAGAGGVGLAAGDYLLWLNLQGTATLGHPRKHRFVRTAGWYLSTSSSRDAGAFISGSATLLGGRRWHGVINSLSLDFITASIALLGEGATFTEIGKRSVWSHERMASLELSLLYHVVALDSAIEHKPLWMSDVLRVLSRRAASQVLRGLPIERFHMAKEGGLLAAFRTIVTGGLGGLGLVTAKWLAQHSASALILASRRGAVNGENSSIWYQASQDGGNASLAIEGAQPWSVARTCAVNAARFDVAESLDVERLFFGATAVFGPRVAGLWHAAGVLADGLLISQTASALRRVYAPKAHGIWNLHMIAVKSGLGACVLFSSIAALLGGGGQANYAAANCCLDAVSASRRQHALPGTSVQWGPWADVGMAAGGDVNARLQAGGFSLITLVEGMSALEVAMTHLAHPSFAVAKVQWSRFSTNSSETPAFFQELDLRPRESKSAAATSTPARAVATSALTTDRVVEIAQHLIGNSVDADVPLLEAGLDSLGAVELKNSLQSYSGTGVLPSSLVYDHPTPRLLTDFISLSVVVDKVDPMTQPSEIIGLDHVTGVARSLLGSTVDPDVPLADAGLDSLGAVEFRNQLQGLLRGYGLSLPNTLVLEMPTLRQLGQHLAHTTAAFATDVVEPDVQATSAKDLYTDVSVRDWSDAKHGCLSCQRRGKPGLPVIVAVSSIEGTVVLTVPSEFQGDVYRLEHEHISTGSKAALSETSLQMLAAKYARIIVEELQGRSDSDISFYLLGASFGSFLAHLIAAEAEKLGRAPAGIVLIEPLPVLPLSQHPNFVSPRPVTGGLACASIESARRTSLDPRYDDTMETSIGDLEQLYNSQPDDYLPFLLTQRLSDLGMKQFNLEAIMENGRRIAVCEHHTTLWREPLEHHMPALADVTRVLVVFASPSAREAFFSFSFGVTGDANLPSAVSRFYGTAMAAEVHVDGSHSDVAYRCLTNRVLEFAESLLKFVAE